MFCENGLVGLLEKFVWSMSCHKMGRPVSSKEKYVSDSEDRISAWELELANKNLDKDESSKLRNRISALKSRVRRKLEVKDDNQVILNASQTNLKEMAKSVFTNCLEK